MKKSFWIVAFTLLATVTYSAKVTIINTGFTFSPAEETINQGDTVVFSLATIHNAVEVSEATWNANGNTPLPGFSVPFGGGTVTGLSAGVHFYVCEPHAAGGMKGKITVVGSSGIPVAENFNQSFRLYPNPFLEKVRLQATESYSASIAKTGIEVYNLLGSKVYEIQQIDLSDAAEINLSSLPSGQYILRINDGKHVYSTKITRE